MDKEKYIEITLDRLGRIELFYLIINTLANIKSESGIRKSFTDSSIDGKTISLTFASYDDGTFEIFNRDTNYVFELDDLNYLCNKVTFIDVYGKDAIVNDDLIDSVIDLICGNLHIVIKNLN
jgi:hypothetical protein